MNVRVLGLAMLAFSVIGFAGDDAEQEKLMGAWESQGANADSKVIWLLEAKGDGLHVTYLEGKQKLAEFECNTSGRDCAVKESGHPAKVSLWFNGPKLVELETKGSEIVKRRFALTGTGEEMDVELIPIDSKRKGETVHFVRRRSNP